MVGKHCHCELVAHLGLCPPPLSPSLRRAAGTIILSLCQPCSLLCPGRKRGDEFGSQALIAPALEVLALYSVEFGEPGANTTHKAGLLWVLLALTLGAKLVGLLSPENGFPGTLEQRVWGVPSAELPVRAHDHRD